MKNIPNTQTKYNPEKKQTTQNTAKQNYPGSVASYDTRQGNEAGLFIQCYRAHTGIGVVDYDMYVIKK